MTEFNYPVSYRQVWDSQGRAHWEGKQNQLNLAFAAPTYYGCKDAIEEAIKEELIERIDSKYLTDMHTVILGVRAEVSIEISENTTLDMFGMELVAEDGIPLSEGADVKIFEFGGTN
jgi:hypothetical protein